jgi:Ni,Fe-hydrogenase III component G
LGAIEKMGQDRKKEQSEVKELKQSFAKIVTEQEEERKKEAKVKVDDKHRYRRKCLR